MSRGKGDSDGDGRDQGKYEGEGEGEGKGKGEGEGDSEGHVPQSRRDPESDGALTPEAAELLERAVGYALGAARFVTPALLDRPTPCAGWDLGSLLAHVDDSLAALHECATGGTVALVPEHGAEGEHAPGWDAADPAASFRRRATGLLGAWAAAPPDRRLVAIAEWPLTAAAVALTGAVEIAVHGWDITRATGRYDHEVPPGLARELLPVAHHLVPVPEARHPLFAPEIPVPPGTPPSARLVAYLGRSPG